MATINLDDTYRIVTDQYNWTLEKYSKTVNKQSKKESYKWLVKGYHSTIDHALFKYIQEVIRDEDTTDIHKLLRKLDDLRDHITKKLDDEVIMV